jgi:hypothetical protein
MPLSAKPRYAQPFRPPTYFHPRPGTRRFLIVALLLGLAFAAWYSWPAEADPELVAVAARELSLEYPQEAFLPRVTQEGRFGSYSLKFSGVDAAGDVHAYAIVRVRATPSGPEIVAVDYYYGSTRNLPIWAICVAGAAILAYLFFFRAVPQTFGRKCPRHGRLLTAREVTLRAPSWDPEGFSHPAIIERTYSCPECDFRHADAFVDPAHRPASVRVEPLNISRDWQFEALEASRRRRRETGITEEEYRRLLAEARERALAKTSRDSPWREK